MTFAVFFVVVLGVSWRLRPRPVAWKLFLLAASYLFYGWWDARFLLLLGASQLGNTIAGFAIARASSDEARRWAVRVGVGGNLALLGFFKYYGFFVESLVALLRPAGLAPTPLLIEIALPVGISFFTFCAISYLVDIGRGKIRPSNVLDVSLFLAFFPHLVAGPIVRASEFMPQLRRPARPDAVDATRAARLIARGLVKKVIIANVIAQVVADPVFGSPGAYGNFDILVAVYGYAVQIYADFSGYTDIAIGTALLLGIRFPQNFDRPYTATSLQDFWRRWHMTLSRWLRDYLYIPLGGNRHGDRATYRNLMLTMLLGGLWHGASWNFVIWGGLHGVGLAAERWVDQRRSEGRPVFDSPRFVALREQMGFGGSPGVEVDADEATVELTDGAGAVAVADRQVAVPTAPLRETSPWLARLAVFHFVALAWIFFRAETLSGAFTLLGRLFTAWSGPEITTLAVGLAIVVGLGAQFLPQRVGLWAEWRVSHLPPVVQAIGFALVLLACDILGPQGVAPFIYFQF